MTKKKLFFVFQHEKQKVGYHQQKEKMFEKVSPFLREKGINQAVVFSLGFHFSPHFSILCFGAGQKTKNNKKPKTTKNQKTWLATKIVFSLGFHFSPHFFILCFGAGQKKPKTTKSKNMVGDNFSLGFIFHLIFDFVFWCWSKKTKNNKKSKMWLWPQKSFFPWGLFFLPYFYFVFFALVKKQKTTKTKKCGWPQKLFFSLGFSFFSPHFQFCVFF
jgi:hypothetical protein